MKNGNFEMDDEEYMEALDLRDEYRYAYKLNHNNPWWNELEELAKKGNIEEYTNFWTSNGVDDSELTDIGIKAVTLGRLQIEFGVDCLLRKLLADFC